MKIIALRSTVIFLPLLLALLPAAAARAETRYISDQLVINLKDRIEQPYTVVAKVRSNEAVTILEENDTHAKVETEGKQVGWISKQYLTTTPPKTLLIDELQKELAAARSQGQAPRGDVAPPELAEIEKERDRLRLELQTAQNRITELEAARPEVAPVPGDAAALTAEMQGLLEQRTQLETEIAQMRAQFESLSDGHIDLEALAREKDTLQKDNAAKDERIAALTAENHRLSKNATLYWFGAGALVFLAGLLSGKISGRKKTKYSY